MLLSFSVKNFGPFQDKVTLSMFPANLKKQHPEHITKLLKEAAFLVPMHQEKLEPFQYYQPYAI